MNKIEMGKEYRTRDGRSVRLLCIDGPSILPVVGIIYGPGSSVTAAWTGSVTSWTSDGQSECSDFSNLDLVEVRKKFKREAWANVYPDYTIVESTRESADRMALSHRVACIKVIIEGEEGEGL